MYQIVKSWAQKYGPQQSPAAGEGPAPTGSATPSFPSQAATCSKIMDPFFNCIDPERFMTHRFVRVHFIMVFILKGFIFLYEY